ncbi:MAG: aminomethyl transferase family protein [candidate division NC10 bacterium]|nr:aminomethyl transferase family protein [candidate division NC10 bacterium]
MERRSRLAGLPEAAVFTEVAGVRLPEHFGDPAAEYRALREAAGVLDRATAGLLRMTGADRVRFLNGMITNDVKALTPGAGLYAALCSPQGKVLGDLRVLAVEEALLLLCEAACRARVAQTLDRFIIADDAKVTDASGEITVLGCYGPKAAEALARVAGSPPPELPPHHHAEVRVAGAAVRVVATPFLGVPGFDLFFPVEAATAVARDLLKATKALGGRAVGHAAFETVRVEAGTPWYGLDFDENNLPQEAGLETTAISFSKGCYIGQETVARIHFRGHVNRRLTGLAVQGEVLPARGSRVLKGEAEVGRVTSAVRSPARGAPVALAMLRREAGEPGTSLKVEAAGTRFDAEVIPLPFAPPVPAA